MWLYLLPIVVATTWAQIQLPTFNEEPTVFNSNNDSYRLPTEVVPETYAISLDVDFTTFEVIGEVLIGLNVRKNTSSITLHSAVRSIENTEIVCESSIGEQLNVSIVTNITESAKQFLTFQLSDELIPNSTCALFIGFTNTLREDQHGFYRANYVDEDGNTRWLAVTQFEPTYAREAFPCFDEPALKAQFSIQLTRPANYSTSIANTPLRTSWTNNEGKRVDLFQTTPIMSTYLVAFVVSDFTSVSLQYQSVYARPDYIAQGRGDFALSIGLEIIPAIEEFLGVRYRDSISKLDNVAIPDNFYSAGAMENWGLVTYREVYLLTNGNQTVSQIFGIADTISHEYGHQWFGNLVSPAWWNYIWINEGFATYFEYYGVNAVRPTWRFMERFALTALQSSFRVDQLRTTRPITTDAETPNEINALFDTIAYSKAGSVIRMVEHFLTTPIFRDGLNRFLVNVSYSSATEYELWDSLQEAANEGSLNLGIPLRDIMTSWTRQAGFPLITITVDRVTGTVSATQERFFFDNSTDESNSTWYVPLNYVTPNAVGGFNDTSLTFLLTQRTQTVLPWGSVDPGDWIIVNKQQTGYYRVNYDNENWRLLINYLNSNDFINIHPLNRAQLIDDALVLAQTGTLSYDYAFGVINYLARETDYVPLYSFFNHIGFLRRILLGPSNAPLFHEFIRDILESAYVNLTAYESADDGPVDRLNRLQVLTTLCNVHHEGCLLHTNRQLRLWRPVSPDLVNVVYCGGLRGGGEEEWNYLYGIYRSNTSEASERTRALSALSCTENSTLLQRLHDMAFLRPVEWSLRSENDRLTVLSSIFSNSDAGIDLFLNINFSELLQSFSVSQVYSVLNAFSLRLLDPARQAVFLRILEIQGGSIWANHGAAFNNAISNINTDRDWLSRYESVIRNWLLNRPAPPVDTTPQTPPPVTSIPPSTQEPQVPATENPGNKGSCNKIITPLILLLSITWLYI